MNNQKSTLFNAFLDSVFLITCLLAGIVCWLFNIYLGAVIYGVFALLTGWSLTTSLRSGLRSSTAFEEYETRLFVRTVFIFIGGAFGLAFCRDWLASRPILGVGAVAGWLGASLYAASRLRGRHESSGAYKRRIHYPEEKSDK